MPISMVAADTGEKAAQAEEVSTMVKKETCPGCKGDKVVRVVAPDGNEKKRTCPSCGGRGYKVRVVSYH